MDFKEIGRDAREAVSARQVFGAPVERHGVTVIPAATVLGGGGGGVSDSTREGDASPPASRGFGFGLIGWPAGAFEIRENEVRWRPARDPALVVIGLLLCGAAILRALRSGG